MASRGLIPAGVLLIASGCQEGVEVRVTQDVAGVEFKVEPRSSGFRACVDGVSVYPASPDDASPVWEAERDRRASACITSVRYGAAGFGARSGPRPLVAGAAYRLMLTGSGFNAAATFERSRQQRPGR